jgi:hypothetical protein
VHVALFESAGAQPNRSTVALGVDGAAFARWQRHLGAVLGRLPAVHDHGAALSLYFDDPDGNPFEITSFDAQAARARRWSAEGCPSRPPWADRPRTVAPMTVSALPLRSRVSLYLDLIRWDRPAGWLLLLWPTLSALWLAAAAFRLAPAGRVRARHGADAQRRLLHQRRRRPRLRPPRQAHRAAAGDARRARVREALALGAALALSPSRWC